MAQPMAIYTSLTRHVLYSGPLRPRPASPLSAHSHGVIGENLGYASRKLKGGSGPSRGRQIRLLGRHLRANMPRSFCT
ncbi:hypothetical protein FOXYSP1_16492 [Fusarium oxysporum f. sp. phaseoli]